MEFNDKINGKKLTDFGIIIQTGTAALLEFPERKDRLINDWAEQNGSEYDLEEPRFKDHEVTLKCALICANDVEFWQKRNAFFEELKKPGFLQLYIDDHSKIHQVFYKKSDNWVKGTKRLKNVAKVFVKFDLTLVVKYEL